MKTTFQKKAGMRWEWKNANGVAKTAIDYLSINGKEKVDEQEANVMRYHTNAIKNG